MLAVVAAGLILRCDSRENRTGGGKKHILTDTSDKLLQTTGVRLTQNKSAALSNLNITSHPIRPLSSSSGARDGSQGKSKLSDRESVLLLRRAPRQLNGVSSARSRSSSGTAGSGGKSGTSKRLVG